MIDKPKRGVPARPISEVGAWASTLGHKPLTPAKGVEVAPASAVRVPAPAPSRSAYDEWEREAAESEMQAQLEIYGGWGGHYAG